MVTTTVGLVLAAGAGRRFGRPKALVRPADDGPTLVESAVATLRASGIAMVVVVVGADAETVWPRAASTAAEVVVAADWAVGLGASLRAGLRHLTADTTSPDIAPYRTSRDSLYFTARTRTTMPSTIPATVSSAVSHT